MFVVGLTRVLENGQRVTHGHTVHAVTNDRMMSLPSVNVEIEPYRYYMSSLKVKVQVR